MDGAQPRTSCRSLFQQSKILPVPTLYILSFMNFIINNQGNFKQIYLYITVIIHLHRPNANLSCFPKSTFYAGINIYNILLASLTLLTNTTVSDWVAAVQCHWPRTLSKVSRHARKSPITLWCKLLEIRTLSKYPPITLCIHILWHVNIIFQSSGYHFPTRGHSCNIPCRKSEAPFDTDDTEFIAIIFCAWNTDFDAAQW